jgi:hypothetical protein
LYANRSGSVWVVPIRPDSAVSSRPAVFPCLPSLDLFRSSSSFLEAFALLQRTHPTACPLHLSELWSFDLHPAGQRAPSLEFPPSSRLQSEAALTQVPIPHVRVFPRVTPVMTCPFGLSALGVSHALDGLLCLRPCELVSSRCRVQGSSFRGFSLVSGPFRISPDLSPPAVGRPSLRCYPRQLDLPRLQGFSPRFECGDQRDG